MRLAAGAPKSAICAAREYRTTQQNARRGNDTAATERHVGVREYRTGDDREHPATGRRVAERIAGFTGWFVGSVRRRERGRA